MKVAQVTGPCIAGRCGVGDYTACLAAALNGIGVETHVIGSDNCRLLDAPQLRKNLQHLDFDIVHIQYPTLGFGTKLGPQALALLYSSVITIHEVSRAHILRKLSLIPFTIRPQHIIFSSNAERGFLSAWAPWVSQMSSVMPIGSNIPGFAEKGSPTLDEIVHFGLIMPGKGLEEVLTLAELIKSSRLPLKVRIIGTPPAKHVAYYEALRSAATDLPIMWDHDLSEVQVAKRLASSAIAYLPYPDGASDRRATLKAMLVNGVAVITTCGPQTPEGLKDLVKFCASPYEALRAALFLIGNPEERAIMARKAREYGRQFTWERIAELHSRIYQNILSSKATRNMDKSRPVGTAWSQADAPHEDLVIRS